MSKKILSILLAVVMMIGIVPIFTFAEEDILDYLEYEIEGEEVIITGYCYATSSFGNHITIPDTIEGYPVTGIGKNYFGWVGALTSVTLPATITDITESAISIWSSMLINISVDEANVNYCSVDGVLFSKDRTELVLYPGYRTDTSYIIPDSVTSIGSYAFSYCDSLVNITIPDSVVTIGYASFSECRSLESITIPDSVITIESRAFEYCKSLENITIPEAVESFGWNVFTGTAHFENVDNWQDGVYYVSNIAIDAREKDLPTDLVIRDGTRAVAASTFSNCTSLASVTFPASVKTIGTGAFVECVNLENIEFAGPVDIGETAFVDCILLEEISGFEYVEHIGKGAFANCYSLDGKLVFENCEVEISGYSLGYSLFALIADIKSIAEHLAQYGHDMYEQHTCENGECYDMYTEKKIEYPDDPNLTQDEITDMLFKQIVDNEFTISGYRGSTAEKYAKEAGINFIALGCYEHEYGEEEVLVAPTYTTPGQKGQKCEYCSHTINITEIPMLQLNNIPNSITVGMGETVNLDISAYPDSGMSAPLYKSTNEAIVKVDTYGNITGVIPGYATVTVDLGNGDVRIIGVTVTPDSAFGSSFGNGLLNNYICFAKTDGIGWYKVSKDGGQTYETVFGNTTYEVEVGTELIIKACDITGDSFEFFVNGTPVKPDDENKVFITVSGYMLINAVSYKDITDNDSDDSDDSLNWFQKIIKAIKNFFKRLFGL